MKALSVVTAAVLGFGTLATTQNAMARFNNRDYQRCNQVRQPFQFNKSNINALVALSCSSLSHIENERRQMRYEDSASMFHQWSTTGDDNKINVKGFCAITLPNLKDENIDRNKIDLTFHKIETSSERNVIRVDGSIVGKSISLEFTNNSFFDNRCANSEVQISQLGEISLGMSFSMQAVIDMVRSQRTGTTLQLLENESWVQGRSSGFYSGLGVMYRMPQFNGRQLGLAMSAGSTASSIYVRSANVLDYFEDGRYFKIDKDSFGQARGFMDSSLPNNHKFESYSIVGGSQMVGCSSLIFDGELDRSLDVDMYLCKQKIQQSTLAKFAQKRYISPTSKAQMEIDRKRQEQQALARKIERFLQANFPPARFYSERPGLYETGRVAWKKEDKDRGYVVMQRSYEVSTENQSIIVTEHRNDSNGKRSTHRFEIGLEEI